MERHRHIRDLAAIALLGVAVLGFFWPLLLTEAWIPRGGGDLVSFLWPMYRFAARSIRLGTVPLWNPHLHSGTPFVADNQSGVFYPVNLLTFLITGPPSYVVMESLAVFHVWLAAVAMFILLRGFGLGRPAAVLGGLAFGLSDLFVTHVGNLNLNATAAWLPLALWLTHKALQDKSTAWAGAAGAIVAVAALAGHGQLLLFVGLTLGLYVVHRLGAVAARAWDSAPRRGRWQAAGQTLGLGVLIAAVGVGGAAITLVPAYQMAGHTGRAHLSYQDASRYSLPPRALIGLLAPGFYGRGPARFWGPWDRVEVGYAGVVTLVLTVTALAIRVSRISLLRGRPASPDCSQQQPNPRFPFGFFALLLPVAFLAAMGKHTPVHYVLYRVVPTFDQIRAPARMIVLGDLALAALAAYALDQLVSNRQPPRRFQAWVGLGAVVGGVVLAVAGLPAARVMPPPNAVSRATRSVAIAVALLAVSGVLIAVPRRLTGRVAWLFPILLAVDLIGLGSTVEIELNDPTLGFKHTEIVDFLRQDPSLFRVDDNASAWQPDAALMHGLYDIGGLYNPLGLAPYQAYRWAVGERGATLYNLLGVKYVLADKGRPPGDERLVPVYGAAPEIDVYLNTAALPRALFVTCPQVTTDHEAAWQAIHSAGFEPTQRVVLEEEQLQDAVAPADCPSADPDTHISFVTYDTNRIELHVKTQVEGWLVLSEVYYPGWTARVDRAQVQLLRANYTFRAVKVPSGEHTVEMRFAPRTWRAGLVLSICTWLGLAAGAALDMYSSRLGEYTETPCPRVAFWGRGR
jgi:hypothetical protein